MAVAVDTARCYPASGGVYFLYTVGQALTQSGNNTVPDTDIRMEGIRGGGAMGVTYHQVKWGLHLLASWKQQLRRCPVRTGCRAAPVFLLSSGPVDYRHPGVSQTEPCSDGWRQNRQRWHRSAGHRASAQRPWPGNSSRRAQPLTGLLMLSGFCIRLSACCVPYLQG